MASISPIPTTRVSDQLVQQRLLSQLQRDQLDVLRLQQQLTTGRRINLPSDDPQASGRAIALQRLLERKTQVRENVNVSQSYLTATDTAIGNVSDVLRSIRGEVAAVVGVTASPEQRAAAAAQARNAVRQLIDIGNRTFRGRYLFGGSRTQAGPYAQAGEIVAYSGNDEDLANFADIDQLLVSNRSGHRVLGGFSAEVQGFADLNPIVTADTLLADLNGGQGVELGTISLSNGIVSRTVDLSGAATVGDVVDLIQGDRVTAPLVEVRLTATGFSLRSTATGSLTVTEVSDGRTALDLGILKADPAGGTRVGDDVNPRLNLTTRLADVLGARAAAVVPPTGTNNDLVFAATQRGVAHNDVTIRYVDGGPSVLGAETVVYDTSNPAAKTLTITVASGLTTASGVIAAVEAAGVPFTAALDDKEFGNNGTGAIQATAIDAAATGVTAGGAGTDLDLASGLRVTNGGQTFTIAVAGATTVEDLLNALSGSPAGLTAAINEAGTGINVLSRWAGADFQIGENGGTTATQLGIRSFHAGTRLADLNHGRGVNTVAGADLIVRRPDGSQYTVDLSSATTIQDVLTALGNDPLSQVTARLAGTGNGIELVAPAGTGQLAVIPTNGSQAAIDLGLVASGGASSSPPVVGGGNEVVTGRDPNPLETEGAFTALLRLAAALESEDDLEIERAMGLLDGALDQAVYQRSDVGAEQQGLDALTTRLEDEDTELKRVLSDEIDVDLAEAISQLTARQASYEATLRTTAQIYQLSLLNFL